MKNLKKSPLALAVVMVAAMLPTAGIIVPALAGDPVSEHTYEVADFEPRDAGTYGSVIEAKDLIAYTVGRTVSTPNTVSKFRLVNNPTDGTQAHPGRVGTFLRDGTATSAWNATTNNVRHTVVEPLPQSLDGKVYPVTEISGTRTLTNGAFTAAASTNNPKRAIRRASTFFTYKADISTAADLESGATRYRYYGSSFIISASATLGFSMMFPDNSARNGYSDVIVAADGTLTSEPGNDPDNGVVYYARGRTGSTDTSLVDYLISVDGEPADATVKESAAGEFERKISLDPTEHWVDYRLYWGEANAVLELTLTLDIPGAAPEDQSKEKRYTFRMNLFNPSAMGEYQRTLAIGGKQLTAANPEPVLQCPNYYGDFTVKYDTTPDACALIDARIAALPDPADLTLDDQAIIAEIEDLAGAVYALSETDTQRLQYREKLLELIAKLAELRNDGSESDLITFEPFQSGIECFESLNAASPDGWSVVNNPFPGGVNTSSKALSFTRNWKDGTSGNLRAVYKLTDDIMPGNRVLSNISGKVYVGTGTSPTLIYDYKNENRWQGLQISISADNGLGILPVSYSGGDALTVSQSYDRAYVRLDSENAAAPVTGIWIEFNLEYTLLNCYMTMRAYGADGELYTGQFPMRRTLVDTSETQFGVCIASGNGYIDDLRVNYQDTEDYMKAKIFLENHSYILNLFPADTYISEIDREFVEAISDDYDGLVEYDNENGTNVCHYLPLMDTRIANIKKALAALADDPDAAGKAARDQALVDARDAVSAQGDYTYTYRYDFTDGLRAFQPARDTMVNPAEMVTEYNEDFGGYVLKTGRYSIATLKKPLLPDKALLVGISFKTKPAQATANSASGRFRVVTRYLHDGALNSYAFYQGDTSVRAGYRASSGSITSPSQQTSVTTDLDINTIWTVKIEYLGAGNRLSTRMTITDEKNNSLVTTQSAVSAESSINNMLALGGSGIPVYMADLEVTYRYGNYDVNEKNDDITVNYAGNTWISPGDVALISGENLTENVLKAEILAVPKDKSAAKGFIDRTWFDYDGVHEDEFSAEPVQPYWEEDAALEVTFVQKTADSLKFIVPKELENGLYAVRLYSSKGGAPKTIYLNTPWVDYTVGTDGAITAAGSDLRVIGKNLAPDESTTDLKAYIIGAGINREVPVSAAQSKYSLSVAVPSDLKNGEYELWLYNGYGNGTAWAIPTKFNVGTPIRSGWSDKVFNVRDYGATGVKSQNATPYIVNALAAVSANGGGTLYFPAGTYSLESELILPKKMIFRGETTGATTLFFRPYKQAYNDLSTVLLAESDIEISNLTVACERIGGILSLSGSASDNIYIENVEFEINPFAGQVTDGSNTTFTNLLPATSENLLKSWAVSGRI
ncbi:MAG: glycoside hydrolase family 55 protein [Oscillospiraceae bacterium]|jgi:hypothetical protein|nr:glycoside hydrolase family 55 protein [Oscillospiraceae bacterium]